jgi:predicted Holliday junction resolvase-like endonuclease
MLADSELFYGSELTPRAEEFQDEMNKGLADMRQRVKELRYALTDGRTKKSTEVKLGKTVEKICPVLPGFPFEPSDCRALFDPIDYVAFVGLTRGSVSRLDFIDVKTGGSALSQRQRQIRDAVSDGAIRLWRLGD